MKENLTLKQRTAIRALLTEPDTTAAAKTAGVSRDTLYRWLADSAFQAALQDGEAAALTEVSRALVRLAGRATATLEGAMTDETTTASVKARAADAVLGRLLQLRGLVDLESRVTDLKARRAVAHADT